MAEPTPDRQRPPTARPIDHQETLVHPSSPSTPQPTGSAGATTWGEPGWSDTAWSDNARSDTARSDNARSDTAWSDNARSDAPRDDTAVLPPHPAAGPVAVRRSPDLVALVAGVLFVVIAVLGLVGASLPGWVSGGGLVAAVLIVIGGGLLVAELRRLRR